MAKLAAFVGFLSCVVLLVQASDEAHQQRMSLFFRKEGDQMVNQRESWSQPRREDLQDPEWTTTEEPFWTEPESEDSNSWNKLSRDSSKQYQKSRSSFRSDSRRTYPSRRDDTWDQDTTTENSWTEPETEDSNSWNEPSHKSFKQTYGKRRVSPFRRDSRRTLPSRDSSSWDQYSTTEDPWSEPETEESNSWTELKKQEESWPHQLPNSRDSWMNVHHFSNEMSPEAQNPWDDDSWTELPSDPTPPDMTEDYETASEVASSRKPASCYQRPERGSCDSRKTRYYYDSETQSCKVFVWSGCEGNQNRFKTREMCESTCGGRSTSIPSGFKCRRDGYFKHPETCEKFIQCSNGRPYEQTCPSGLHFSLSSLTCQAPCDAFCDPTLSDECGWDSAPHATREIDCTASPDKGPCDSLTPRYYYDSDSSRCRRFFYGGCRGNTNNFRTQEECEETCGSSLTRSEPFYCPRPNGRFADIYDCTTYFQCQDGESKVKRCPRGQWFDYRRRACTSDDSASCFYKCRQPEGMYSYLPDCQKYVKCSQGKPTVVRCPSGQAFHKLEGRCVPQSEVNCGVVPDQTSVKVELTDSKDYRCPTPSGNYPKVDDCAKYWSCAHGIANEQDCEDKFFNPETLECDEQGNVSCPAYEIGKKVICYFDNDPPEGESILPEELSPYLCTHIHYNNAMLEHSGDSYTISSTKRENDIVLGYYKRVVDLKKLNQKLKVMLTLGGWKDSESAKYSQLVSDVNKWPSFIQAVIQYLRLYNFDGLEFDWEFPVCRTKDCNGRPPVVAQKERFQSFLEMLYSRLSDEKLLLSVKVSGEKPVFENSYKMEKIGNVTDYIVVMAYLPPGESQFDTVPPSVLNAGKNKKHTNEDASTIMALWKHKVQNSSKLILGVRGNARAYQLSDTKKTDVYSPIPAHGIAPQDLSYRTVCSHLKSHDWKKGSSPQVADFIYQDVTWIGYQSPENMRKFAEHVMRHSYGGVALISNLADDFKGSCCHVKNPLLKGLTVGFSRRGMTPSEFGCP
ncbi:probable chitinase 10 isoform X1 [Uloborus diversus]|uniref:probable chitinase 10 isoform X1 n=1 Tax=Uloborus diversus TaxID=327109 RepID=UPI0024093581|nr:probable chitinase 10 isoform X1 [Uloborus diversus]